MLNNINNDEINCQIPPFPEFPLLSHNQPILSLSSFRARKKYEHFFLALYRPHY